MYIIQNFMVRRIIALLIFTLIFFNGISQVKEVGIPFIRNYSHVEYKANNQNFAIVQDNRGILYFANQTVILEFDGRNWRQIFLPEESTIYSMAKDQRGRIYIGASNGELGYLKVDTKGDMKYVSLSKIVPESEKEFTRVRNIVIYKDEVIFITPISLLIYKDNKFRVIKVKTESNRFVLPFPVGEKLYIQEKGRGILEYTRDSLKILKGTPEQFAENWVTGMFPYKGNSESIVTWNSGTFKYKDGLIEPLENDSLLYGLYCYSKIGENNYALGMYSKGVVYTDLNLKPVKKISTKNGLQNNQVYSILKDIENNIWFGLANGISVIYSNSPYSVYTENYGLTGTTYTSMLFEGKLYIGSSTGVFHKNWTNANPLDDDNFVPIKNKAGAFQIWQIDTIDNKLLGAGSGGFFMIRNDSAIFLRENISYRTFIQLKENPNIVLAGGGNGLSIFEFKNNTWKFKNDIKNFAADFRQIVEDNDGSIWLSDRTEGLYRLKLNTNLDSVIENKLFKQEQGLPSNKNNYIFKLSNRIVFTTEKGIFRFDKNKNTFVADEKFAKIFDYDIKITMLHRGKNGTIWFKEELEDTKNKNKKHWLLGKINEFGDSDKIEKTPFLKVRDNIYTINMISDNDLIIGNEKGFVHYDLKFKKDFNSKFNTAIRKIEIIKNDSLIFDGAFSDTAGVAVLSQDTKKFLQISYEYNALRFNFSAIFFEEPENTQYKFMLEGDEATWSDWKYETTKEYSNLQPGVYTFKVKAKNIYGIESNVAEYKFEILPPWYRSVIAFISYLFLLAFFIWGIVQLSIRRVKLQKENLERIVKERTAEIEMQNVEILAQRDSLFAKNEEIDHKNKDITSSLVYAKRIQEAMLPLKENISSALDEYFILLKPRDIVSGDFYWFAEKEDKIIISAVDCTGHGVPGAFMSMIGSEILTTIVNQKVTDAAEILQKMNKYVITALKQDATSNQDGMDLGLCVIDKKKKTLEFSGAKNPMVYIENGNLHYIKGDRQAIGGSQKGDGSYEKHIINYQSPSWFYIFSDGYQDQFGGKDNRKFMIKRLKELLFEIHTKSADEQYKILDDTIMDWMSTTTQTDDIILIGFKL